MLLCLSGLMSSACSVGLAADPELLSWWDPSLRPRRGCQRRDPSLRPRRGCQRRDALLPGPAYLLLCVLLVPQ